MRVLLPATLALLLAGCVTPDRPGPRASAPDFATLQGCIAAFVRPDSALARDIAGLPDPPECARGDGMTSLMAAGVPAGDTPNTAGIFARGLSATIVRAEEPLPRFGRIMADDRLARDPTVRTLDVPERGTVRGRGMVLTTLVSPDAAGRTTLVCVYASDQSTGTTTAQICRDAAGRDERVLRATAARIVTDDLPAVAW